MYLPQNDISEVVLRQRNRKDDLSKELAKNKSKLNAVQQEYRFLTQPLNTDYVDECERLDDEIDKLRRVCQVMLNEIEHLKRSQEPHFDRQPVRTAPLPPLYPPPRMRPQSLFPRQQSNSSPLPSRNHESPSAQSNELPTSPSMQDIVSASQPPKPIDDVCDPSCGEQPWQCSMCTFQNHPLLNKCECCEIVRILPGSVRIVPSRPPPPIPLAVLGSRSAPLTPATPITPSTGPVSASIRSRSTEYTRPGVTNSSSEGSMPQFLGDVVI